MIVIRNSRLRLFALVFISVTLLFLNFPLSQAKADSSETFLKPYLDKISHQVSEFQLANGLKFIVLENHQSPTISFVTYANVGGVDEPDGKTGVAHFLEHLAFKGTQTIGTTDYSSEKPLLDKLNLIFEGIKENQKRQNLTEVQRLEKEFEQIEQQAQQYVRVNEFGQIVEKNGGQDLNAQTSADSTVYFYSFPSNKLELWMSLESERFLHPVFREFFKEKQVILEERRMRTEDSPIGQLLEAFLNTAFTNHPYKRPVIGYTKDLRTVSPENVSTFFNSYYSPHNLTMAIVGDVNPQEVEKLAKKYFSRYPSSPVFSKVDIIEPKQIKSKEVDLSLNSQPWFIEGFHVPALSSGNNAVYDVISSILTQGRTSRLYKSLIEKQRLAILAQGDIGFPGNRYPNLMIFYALTTPGTNVNQIENALDYELELLKTEPVTSEELERAKTTLIADIFSNLDSNLNIAKQLAEYQAKTGSWRNLFSQIEAIKKVSRLDIQKIAKETFRQDNRTIGRILTQKDNALKTN
jgi:predicted Zn-dependent peptidase